MHLMQALSQYASAITTAAGFLSLLSWLASNLWSERLKRQRDAIKDATASRDIFDRFDRVDAHLFMLAQHLESVLQHVTPEQAELADHQRSLIDALRRASRADLLQQTSIHAVGFTERVERLASLAGNRQDTAKEVERVVTTIRAISDRSQELSVAFRRAIGRSVDIDRVPENEAAAMNSAATRYVNSIQALGQEYSLAINSAFKLYSLLVSEGRQLLAKRERKARQAAVLALLLAGLGATMSVAGSVAKFARELHSAQPAG